MKGIVLIFVLCAIQGYSQETAQLTKFRDAVIERFEDQMVSVSIEFTIKSYDNVKEIVVEEVLRDGSVRIAERLPLNKLDDGKVILRAYVLTDDRAMYTYRIPGSRLSALEALAIYAEDANGQKSSSLRYQLNP